MAILFQSLMIFNSFLQETETMSTYKSCLCNKLIGRRIQTKSKVNFKINIQIVRVVVNYFK